MAQEVVGSSPITHPMIKIQKLFIAGWRSILISFWALCLVCGYVFLLFNSQLSPLLNSVFFAEEKSENILKEKDNLDLEKKSAITIVAVGDILLTREVFERSKKAGSVIYPFLETAHFLEDADFTFGNLETTVFEGKKQPADSLRFRSNPEMLLGLNFAGFDLVSIANNHIFNFGEEGIIKTTENLDKYKIDYCGAGQNSERASMPLVYEVKNVKIAWLCYNDTDVVPDSSFALEDKAGSWEMKIENLENDLKKLEGKSDLIFVSIHSGSEYSSRPNKRQKDFARSAIDLGVNVVIGHHPHVLQPMEFYKDGLIFYSLGNFVFDQEAKITKESVILKLTIETSSFDYKIEFVPVFIEDFSKPKIVEESQKKQNILKKILPVN